MCIRDRKKTSPKKSKKVDTSECVVTRDVIVTPDGVVYKRQGVNEHSIAAAMKAAADEATN